MRKMSEYSENKSEFVDAIIFGKNDFRNVVSVECSDGHLEVFTQQKDGTVKSEFVPNKYWILGEENPDNSWSRLKGDLHFKYGKQISSIEEYYRYRSKIKHKIDTYSLYDIREASLINKGITYFKDLDPKDVSILSFDIETTGLRHDENSKLLVIANTFRKNGIVSRKLFAYDQYDNEGEMLKHWCNWVRKIDPSILCGHNIFSYDIPYIKFIADKYNVQLELGRDRSKLKFNPYQSSKRIDGNREQEYNNVRCFGREIVDTYFLALTYDIASKKYETYALKKIIEQEGLEAKGRVFYDAAKIRDNYKIPEEWVKIKKYAEFDGDDSLALFDLMIPSFFYFNRSVPKTFQQMILSASGSQLNSMLVRSYLQNGHSIPKANEVNKFQAAISYGNPGIHTNVFKVDVASLYPSIILQYQIYDKIKDPLGNYLKMALHFTNERFRNKDLAKETGLQYYKDLEQAQKIAINSLFGLMGTNHLNFNNQQLAELITRYGREILQLSIKWAMGRELIHVKIPKKTEKGKDKFEWLDPNHFNSEIHERLSKDFILHENVPNDLDGEL